MTKAAALQGFWGSFSLPAYEENTVPDDAVYPYITYEAASDAYGSDVVLSGSLWYRSSSWVEANAKSEEIGWRIGYGGILLPCDGGKIWVRRGNPFAQNMGDEADDMIRRKIINISVSFLTVR